MSIITCRVVLKQLRNCRICRCPAIYKQNAVTLEVQKGHDEGQIDKGQQVNHFKTVNNGQRIINIIIVGNFKLNMVCNGNLHRDEMIIRIRAARPQRTMNKNENRRERQSQREYRSQDLRVWIVLNYTCAGVRKGHSVFGTECGVYAKAGARLQIHSRFDHDRISIKHLVK